ncbi:MAG: hypothetical protein P0S94_00700 [Simkaniaceae bacterium]|nr:hypothetical protein [Simkaniaceae bacterium]
MQITVTAHSPTHFKVSVSDKEYTIKDQNDTVSVNADRIILSARREIATVIFCGDENYKVLANVQKEGKVTEKNKFHLIDLVSSTQWLLTAHTVENVFNIKIELLPQHPRIDQLGTLPTPSLSDAFRNVYHQVNDHETGARLFVIYSRITGEIACFPGNIKGLKTVTYGKTEMNQFKIKDGTTMLPSNFKDKTGHLQLAEMIGLPSGSYFGFTAFAGRGINPNDDDCLRSEANPCKDLMSRSAPQIVAQLVAKAFNAAVEL